MLKYHIQTVELTSTQSSISFNSIPQDFTDLIVKFGARTNAADVIDTCLVDFNGISTGFTNRSLYGDPGGASSAQFNEARRAGHATGATQTANTFSTVELYIPNYAGSTNKSVSVESASEGTSSYFEIMIGATQWSNTAPINSITIRPFGSTSFVSGSSFSLYGVRRGDSKETASATGGTVTTSGGYTIHTFNTSGTFSVNRGIEAEYIVVAGGGGGGRWTGGGGGAGGYRSSVTGESSGGGASAESKLTLPSGSSYAITVGAGGAAGNPVGGQGVASSFAGISSVGGGGGAGYDGSYYAGTSGGSGGGGISADAGTTMNGLPGTTNQGFAGGNGSGAPTGYQGGGGGGSASAGLNASLNTGGNGGNGVTSSITGTAVARAGGGGAGVNGTSQTIGLGQAGGGNGTNASNLQGGTGATNSGSGGGGSGWNGSPSTTGGPGGSGVVIIRYLTP